MVDNNSNRAECAGADCLCRTVNSMRPSCCCNAGMHSTLEWHACTMQGLRGAEYAEDVRNTLEGARCAADVEVCGAEVWLIGTVQEVAHALDILQGVLAAFYYIEE